MKVSANNGSKKKTSSFFKSLQNLCHIFIYQYHPDYGVPDNGKSVFHNNIHCGTSALNQPQSI